MNIFVVILLMSIADIPTLPEKSRATRRAARSKAIAHNHRIYHDVIGGGIWFEQPHEDGVYHRHASGHRHANSQQGRWATERLSGHRRFEKWSRDYYGSPEVELDKYFQRIDRRWEERYEE